MRRRTRVRRRTRGPAVACALVPDLVPVAGPLLAEAAPVGRLGVPAAKTGSAVAGPVLLAGVCGVLIESSDVAE